AHGGRGVFGRNPPPSTVRTWVSTQRRDVLRRRKEGAMTYDLFSVLAVSAMCFSAAVSGILIVALIRLRKDVLTFESMVMWKWSEAPWWTRPESDFQASIETSLRNRAGSCCCCRNMAADFTVTVKDREPELPG